MSLKMKMLAGAAGIAAAVGVATPAAAQYYPGSSYPGYGYGNNQGGVVGAIINSVLGYGQYPHGNYGYNSYRNQSSAVNQCARAVEARINGYRGGYYGYGGQGYGYGYGYNNQAQGRVQGITRVERKSYGLKVYGVASSGNRYYDGYGRGGYGSYGYNAGADLRFNCEVRYDGRIRDIDVKRRTAQWRGY
ncbi:hypothetical protein [Sphingomonas xanthus]|uniref:17 kDa surface antigen n=1 Tax=Sphingomonas xanthus TaxID=2594473 RepID=A0A516IQI4_9SPHN|nr:hypothetical protein [Sphingomonas xanthus]QDP19180.1 hypothetical protein FMM02_03900 [Sphingomonas xanthus]